MSMISLELTGNAGPESKRYKMKQFVDAAKEYSKTRSDSTAILMNRHLQALSVTIDLGVFDPNSSIVSEFFVSLHQLMSDLEQRSAIAWNCIEVLSNACRNPSTRRVLIHTYQFLSPLSRLLGDQLTREKKLRLLTLMQELTCGIKISWLMPHLPHLMLTLTKWVESNDEEIVTLSLGVLVNLCYKNLPAIYTLSRHVDIKNFVRTCTQLQGLKIQVHVCKLLIILDYLNGRVPEESILKLIQVMFKSMIEAFSASDSILLRHVVEFFLDVLKQSAQAQIVASYQNYEIDVENLLNAVENNVSPNHGDNKSYDPECMSLLFEFMHSIIEMKFMELTRLYPGILSIALKWIETDIACTQALSVLRTIAVRATQCRNVDLGQIETNIPVLIMSVIHRGEETPTNVEYQKRMGALLQLLRALAQVPNLRDRILQDLTEDMIEKLFMPVVTGNQGGDDDSSTYSEEALNVYIYAMGLVDELSKHSPGWLNLRVNLLQLKQIHIILAQALYGGPKDVKKTILNMTSSDMFPTEEVTDAMVDMQRIVQVEKTTTTNESINNVCFPVISVTKLEMFDDVINQLKQAIAQGNFANISTSNVMELYEYKLASMGHAERAATASLEAASQRCIHFQHRTAQLTAELYRLHQLLFQSQQCHEQAVKNRDILIENNKLLESKMIAERGKYNACASQLKNKEKVLNDIELELKEMGRKLQQAEVANGLLKQQNNDLKMVMEQLENNLMKKEKVLDKKNEEIKKANDAIETLKLQASELEKQLTITEKGLMAKVQELEMCSRDLEAKKQIISTITKVANSQL